MQNINKYRELGNVTWERDYQAALEKSEASSKPILLLFQEVPGCSTCVNYGIEALSFPLMVEAIENEFVPLLIHNNKDGEDAVILKKFNEPAWNNPVVYFLNEKGESIVSKLSYNYSPLALYDKMIKTLIKLGKDIPEYIKILEKDLKIKYGHKSTTYYETPCFWSGETSLIQKEGVLSTEAGWISGKEVVKVDYDTEVVNKQELDAFAQNQGFYKLMDVRNYKVDKEPQYYLFNSVYASLPLSFAQRSLINYAIPYKAFDPMVVLSPKQLRWIEQNNKINPKAYQMDFEKVWKETKQEENETPTYDKTTQ